TTDPNSKIYGNGEPSPLTTGGGTNFVAGDGVTASYSRVAGENASPPTYHITAILSATVPGALNNYNITNTGADFTIDKRALDITANNESKNYGDVFSFTGSEFTTGAGQLVTGDSVTSVTLTSAGAAATATVGGSPYTIVPSAAVGSGLGNYNISYHNASIGLTVNAIALDITANNQSKNYGDTFTFTGSEFTVVAGQLKNSDSVTSVTLSSAGAAATATVGGSPYTIVPSAAVGSGLGNYNISYHDASIGLTVNVIALDITANNQSKTYGATFTFTGSEFTTGAGQLLNGDSVTSVTLTSTGAAATATVGGSPYVIVASNATGTGLGNYIISYHDGSLTVEARGLDITANDQSKTYGATFSFTGAEFTTAAGQLVNGDTVTSVALISAGSTATATVAGSPYDITPSAATGTGLGNYTITYHVGHLTVDAKGLDITANDRTKTYGDMVIFAGTESGSAGLVNGDTVTSVTLTSAGAAATAGVGGSPYDITPSAAIGTGLGNYTIAYHVGHLTVNRKDATVAADNKTKTYGDDNPTLTATVTGTVNGDTLNYTLATTAVKFSGVGDYAITVALGSNPNYNASKTDGNLHINPKTASVAADNKSKTYGDPNPALTATVTGTVNGDTLNYTLATTAVQCSNVGPYPITVTLGSNANYTVTSTNGTLTIIKKHLTVTAANKSKAYDGNPFTAFTVTITGFTCGDTVAVVSNSATYTGNAVGATLPGTYTITPQQGTLSATNYDFTPFVNGTLTIGYGTCTGPTPGGVILPPINQDGSSVWKVGSTVPVKFTVCGADGQPIADPNAVFASGYGSITLINTVRGTVNNVNETTYNDIPDSAFRWSGGQWIFNMATGNLQKNNTYQYRIALKNGDFVYFTAGTK
ncbi:MAG: hypothetical protein DME95_03925, partial [Verrucomicrobia bacterium]